MPSQRDTPAVQLIVHWAYQRDSTISFNRNCHTTATRVRSRPEPEVWIREKVREYKIVKGEKVFNSASHVSDALRLCCLIPKCMRWVMSGRPSDDTRRKHLILARRGRGKIIEAHPRMFLYSALERIERHSPGAVCNEGSLHHIRQYKTSVASRHGVYTLLQQYGGLWQGERVSQMPELNENSELFADSDRFDAWLAALTARAHKHKQTMKWRAAKLPRQAVDTEGHILILSQKDDTEANGADKRNSPRCFWSPGKDGGGYQPKVNATAERHLAAVNPRQRPL